MPSKIWFPETFLSPIGMQIKELAVVATILKLGPEIWYAFAYIKPYIRPHPLSYA